MPEIRIKYSDDIRKAFAAITDPAGKQNGLPRPRAHLEAFRESGISNKTASFLPLSAICLCLSLSQPFVSKKIYISAPPRSLYSRAPGNLQFRNSRGIDAPPIIQIHLCPARFPLELCARSSFPQLSREDE